MLTRHASVLDDLCYILQNCENFKTYQQHNTSKGSTVAVKDNITGIMYKLELVMIASTIEAKKDDTLTFNQIMRKFSNEN